MLIYIIRLNIKYYIKRGGYFTMTGLSNFQAKILGDHINGVKMKEREDRNRKKVVAKRQQKYSNRGN